LIGSEYGSNPFILKELLSKATAKIKFFGKNPNLIKLNLELILFWEDAAFCKGIF
jgi:hypothetical protein